MTKVAVIITTYNNPVLLRHTLENYKRYSPGVDCDYHVVDSGDGADGRIVSATVHKQENNRAESLFHQCATELSRSKKYTHYFFAHDDCVPHKDGWLSAFMDRLRSNYAEPEAPESAKRLPIGRVGAMHHYWRDYCSVKGFPVQAQFVQRAYKAMWFVDAPYMFKYADVDRILMTRVAFEACGIVSTESVYHDSARGKSVRKALDECLQYYDEGTYPLSKYPPGGYWNRLTLLAEFLNSVEPLGLGFRTVGLEGDGYLEQIHGADVPWGHNYIAHYGAPNALAFLSKVFRCGPREVKQRFNNPAFLMQTHKLFKDYYA